MDNEAPYALLAKSPCDTVNRYPWSVVLLTDVSEHLCNHRLAAHARARGEHLDAPLLLEPRLLNDLAEKLRQVLGPMMGGRRGSHGSVHARHRWQIHLRS